MCDYSEYSIVGPEHCVYVPALTEESREVVLGVKTPRSTWELTLSYNGVSKCIESIGIKRIHGPVNQSEEKEPLAEIVIWRWKISYEEIIEKLLFHYNDPILTVFPKLADINEVHFIFRQVEKRKAPANVCAPLEYLVPSDAFTIAVGEQNFVVSGCRLMQISPHFRAMLKDEMKEKANRKVEVKETDVDTEQMRAFLEVIDPDQNIQPNPSNVRGVLELAEYYGVTLAKDRCEVHLVNCVELPLIERLQLAVTYKLNALKHAILSIDPVKLRSFCKSNIDQLMNPEFICRDLLNELFCAVSNE